MKSIWKPLALAAAVAAAGLSAAPAQARVVVGVGIGVPFGYGYYGPRYYGPAYYGYYGAPVYAEPYGYYPPRMVVAAPAAEPAPTAADPIFYPKNGQTAAQTETDRRACNQWAAGQAGAMADASVFQRATYACMDGRGYTVK